MHDSSHRTHMEYVCVCNLREVAMDGSEVQFVVLASSAEHG